MIPLKQQAGSFQQSGDIDEKLANMLALYKAPASIRDLKQVYFYTQVVSNLTNIEPLSLFYNMEPAIALEQKQFYFAPIGTTREFNIVDQVNNLMDIRVPKDKYVIEINLAECVIEANPEKWQKIPDRVAKKTGTLTAAYPTYNWADQYNAAPQPDANPPRYNIGSRLNQATKLSKPQTLYVRIRELSNGEPYNWSVTNSGAYSIDKSHQLLVRHGDINYSKLTLEFGHVVFKGRDYDYTNQLADPSKNIIPYRNDTVDSGEPFITKSVERYNDYKYVDYNSEQFNVVTKLDSAQGSKPYRNDVYPEFYKGEGGVDYVTTNQKDVAGATNLIQPANRPPFFEQAGVAPNPVDYDLQGEPLLYNQQVSKIGFRFLVRIIHLF